jgi:hypothetical protein
MNIDLEKNVCTDENDLEEIDESEEENESDQESCSDDEEVDESIKKKRGRKKKEITDENSNIEKIQKKRGRKPKVKDVEENEKIPKKRGRKPKEKVYSVKELPKTFFEENKNETFILHLPIKSSDLINNIPLPNISNENTYSFYDNNLGDYKVNNDNLLPTQFNLMNHDNLSNLENNVMVFNDEQTTYDYKVLANDSLKIANMIKKDEEENDNKSNKMVKKKLKNILYEFINSNNEKSWPETTNIYCWWCCHPFSCMPCALPEYYRKDKFYVCGCFCSFNCSASYNFSKNDDDMWERYSLLNLMYKKLYNEKFVKINLAPPREILKIFGGYMTIEEFRENSYKNEKTFVVVKPPLISIIPKIEENINNKTNKNNLSNVNENILTKTQNTLKLKRNKPVTNPNSTLQSFMDLKII